MIYHGVLLAFYLHGAIETFNLSLIKPRCESFTSGPVQRIRRWDLIHAKQYSASVLRGSTHSPKRAAGICLGRSSVGA
jgi:hypothetical protein